MPDSLNRRIDDLWGEMLPPRETNSTVKNLDRRLAVLEDRSSRIIRG